MNLFDIVALTQNCPDEGLSAGAKGAIVHIHHEPCLAYEVEFCDDQGRTVALLALLPSQVERVWEFGSDKS